MSTSSPGPVLGRRDRNKADKQRRILDAVVDLFHASDFDDVTTQQVADRADVSVGTLFRYAQSKEELLLMAGNDMIGRRVKEILAEGRGLTDGRLSVIDQICQLLEPFIDVAVRHPANFTHYYQGIFFGADGPYRREAMATLASFEEQLGAILATAPDRPLRFGITPREAGRLLWSSLSLEIAGMTLGAQCRRDVHTALRQHVDLVLNGLLGQPGGGSRPSAAGG